MVLHNSATHAREREERAALFLVVEFWKPKDIVRAQEMVPKQEAGGRIRGSRRRASSVVLCSLLLSSQKGRKGSLPLNLYHTKRSQSTPLKTRLQPRHNLVRKFLCSSLELSILARTSNVSWEGRQKGRALPAIKPIFFLEITQAIQAHRKEREGLSYAILDGNREAANLQPTNLCLGKSKAYIAWALPSVTL